MLCLLDGAAHAQQTHEHHPGHGASDERSGPEFARFAREMDAGMEQMMRGMHAPGYSGSADIDFLAMMIPHHEGAVEMARLVLVHGRDPLTRKLAEDIIAGQVVEIEGMKRRLEILRAGPEPRPGDFPALGGTRGPAK
jgi:uncharacterized protein (DUF305 family)